MSEHKGREAGSDSATAERTRCDAPFFVVGSSRSGTTMLRLMLNAHSRLHVPHESGFLIALMDRLPNDSPLNAAQVQVAYETVSSHWRWKEWGFEDEALLTVLEELSEPMLGDVIRGIFGLHLRRSGSVRWGDKTPEYATEVGRLHRVLPEAQFIHLIRDGRDVAMSIKSKGWHGETTAAIARYWAESNAVAASEGRVLPEGSFLRVSYEALVLETEATLRKVCSFLGESFERDMLSFHDPSTDLIPRPHLNPKIRRAPQLSDVERWRSDMSPIHVAIFEAFAGDVMDEMGQRRRFGLSLPFVRTACRVAEWGAESSLPLRRRLGLRFPGLRGRL